MKKYRAILFDLDGTLLPMDMNEFVNGYFGLLTAKAVKEYDPALDPKMLVKAIWGGTKAMVLNDGSRTNREVFWEVCGQMMGAYDPKLEAVCDAFYGSEFKGAKVFTGENPLAVQAVRTAHEKAEKVVLATNPFFPRQGQLTRMSFVGLQESDFDLITTYESDYYCKPNPAYFDSVCERIGVRAKDCLMIGNDEREDMYAGSQAGIDGFLVTDCLIPCGEHPYRGPRGTFREMLAFLESLS